MIQYTGYYAFPNTPTKKDHGDVFYDFGKSKRVIFLRTIRENMSSRNDFRYPKRGKVDCKDYRWGNQCGNGLHGITRNQAAKQLMKYGGKYKYLIMETTKEFSCQVTILGAKIKCGRANVLCVATTKEGAAAKFAYYWNKYNPQPDVKKQILNKLANRGMK